MNKKTNNKDILIVFLICILLFSLWQFISINKELKLSQNKLQHIQTKIDQEKKEKEQYKLQADNLNLSLESANTQLEVANKQLTLAKTQLEKLDILEADKADLLLVKQELEQKILNLENEKQVIEAKLHSLTELRKFVRQVKNEIHEQNIQQYLARKQQQKEFDEQEALIGNRGFITKGSKSTYKATIRIEVKPEVK